MKYFAPIIFAIVLFLGIVSAQQPGRTFPDVLTPLGQEQVDAGNFATASIEWKSTTEAYLKLDDANIRTLTNQLASDETLINKINGEVNPFITNAPQNVTVPVGGTATFSVNFTGAGCRTHWFYGPNAAYGSIGPGPLSFQIANVSSAMNGWQVFVQLFDCGIASNVNLGDSAKATLTVTP